MTGDMGQEGSILMSGLYEDYICMSVCLLLKEILFSYHRSCALTACILSRKQPHLALVFNLHAVGCHAMGFLPQCPWRYVFSL